MPKTLSLTETVFQNNVVILSGHGAFPGDPKTFIRKFITIPARFTVTVWTWHRGTGADPSLWLLDDSIGNLIDSGHFQEAYAKVNQYGASGAELKLPITYEAGEKIANLMILPPRRNKTGKPAEGHKLFTVDRVGSLEDFLANLQYEFPGGANVHWSACAENITARARFGQVNEGEGPQNLLELAKLYYEAQG
ncbi:putative adhesin [Aquabacterium sp. NJ1]|uniref:putative adhesin n=1 Tax=Aquabacterium sp. NJ1 TaxID=1538295 RepID=UPI001269EDDA|nr:hypothetical protein [Aquabacterium sp. NJ1]